MKRLFSRCLFGILPLMILAACLPETISDRPELITTARTPETTLTPGPALSLQPTTDLSFSNLEGPFLLLQTDFNVYQILDLNTQSFYSFDLPISQQSFRFAKYLSPSGSQMLFPTNDQEVLVMSFRPGEISTSINLQKTASLFDPKMAAQQARQALPGLNYTEEALIQTLSSAFSQSISTFQWYTDDQHILTVQEGSPTSTHLSLFDRQAQSHKPLESSPALVEDFWVGPNRDLILVKKGYIFEPGVWQDDRYYLLDSSTNKVQAIPVPEDSKNPGIFWLSPDLIGITHQTQPAGGISFSTYDIHNQKITRVIKGTFAAIQFLGDEFLFIRHEGTEKNSRLEMRTLDGNLVQSQVIQDTCFFKGIFQGQIILNCQETSLVLNKTLQTTPFGQPVVILSPSPDGQTLILVNRSDEIFLLDAALQNQREIFLSEPPREIVWTPDSSGFLYRTAGKLFYYDLEGNTNQLLFESALFTDYSNLNAVWIKTE